MKRENLKKWILAALFLAVGYVLPYLTGMIPAIGKALLPMHLPVLLCGLICGWPYGLAVGAILPLARSLTLSMPPLYPDAVVMTFELAAYGCVIGLLWRYAARKKNALTLYACLIGAMLAGRIVWGAVKALLFGVAGKPFGLAAFWAGGFANALPGIILQLILIPAIMLILNRAGALKTERV